MGYQRDKVTVDMVIPVDGEVRWMVTSFGSPSGFPVSSLFIPDSNSGSGLVKKQFERNYGYMGTSRLKNIGNQKYLDHRSVDGALYYTIDQSDLPPTAKLAYQITDNTFGNPNHILWSGPGLKGSRVMAPGTWSTRNSKFDSNEYLHYFDPYGYRGDLTLSGSFAEFSLSGSGYMAPWSFGYRPDLVKPWEINLLFTLRYTAGKPYIIITGSDSFHPSTYYPVKVTPTEYVGRNTGIGKTSFPMNPSDDFWFSLRDALTSLPSDGGDASAFKATRNALEKAGTLDMNNLENLRSWADYRSGLISPELVQKISMAAKKSSSFLGLSVAAANLYLSVHYQYQMDAQDMPKLALEVTDLVKEMTTGSPQILYGVSSSTALGVTKTCHVLVACQPFDSVVRQLDAVGLRPSMENFWDLVPLSFVIDWFIPTGDTLHEITFARDWGLNRWGIQYGVYSTKVECVFTKNNTKLPSYGSLVCVAGSVKYVSYLREPSETIPTYEFEVGAKNPLNHLIEGGSLIIANFVK